MCDGVDGVGGAVFNRSYKSEMTVGDANRRSSAGFEVEVR